MTKGMPCPDSVGCSKLILRLNKPWCSRKITKLNKMEVFYLSPISSFLNLIETHYDSSSYTCTYFLPQSLQTESLMAVVFDQEASLYKIGVFMVMIDDIPIIMKDEDSSFTFEATLLEAYKTNDEKVLFFLTELNISLPLENDNTALVIASKKEDSSALDAVKALVLSEVLNNNIQNDKGWTALMYASANGYHQVVELLLNKNPDINIQDNEGWTALMHASVNDPDINIQDIIYGMTALMLASNKGHHQVVELLLSKNPDINIQDNDGQTALMYACHNGHHQVVKLLLHKNPDINIQDNDGQTALMYACHNGHHQVFQLLLSKNPDINIRDNDGQTALMYACHNGHHQVVELLLHKNPDINSQNSGITVEPLYNVCSDFTIAGFTSPDECARLLDKFSFSNFITILELLLDYHPNHIHTINGKELHSLELAALSNNFDAVAVCMKKCDITPEDIISAISLACYGGHSSMIIHLSEKIMSFSNGEGKLLAAAAEGDLGTLISMIYEVGISPDTPLVAGITPLMIAASCGHIELVDTLIQAGADVNRRNDEGMNALDIVNGVEFYNRSDIKELLITNTPAGEPDPVSNNSETTDPVSNNAESTNKKHSTVTAIKSIFGLFSSFMKKAYDPYYSKQKQLKIPYGIANTPNSAVTNNMSQLVS
ncbi:PREDICTED: ankyrin repeat domain-containing protein 50-like [Amphimedon queenslandica]|uniref:Uncharacterized protein n=1 Tax=Amphimedon queenslandica TaxID=400682 RepID=A0AAN0JM36_AMPQE|nr:PREDICTED: ankyrin repeat domain-containing protein 50-like [Amphimedon queenslandica]|eukprot:XP_019857878.1 PREDICTED: ankyrin repeat domain-containing protein 50-like [Amphimedon queenslandica]